MEAESKGSINLFLVIVYKFLVLKFIYVVGLYNRSYSKPFREKGVLGLFSKVDLA